MPAVAPGLKEKAVEARQTWSPEGSKHELLQAARQLAVSAFFRLQRLNLRLCLLQGESARYRLPARFGNQVMMHIQRPGLTVKLSFLDNGVPALSPADGITDHAHPPHEPE